MPQYHFDDVSLVLVEGNRDIRGSIRASLRHEGFGTVRDTHRPDRARDWVAETPPDLVIADTDYLNGGASRIIHGIRHAEFGQDPFIPVIALSSEGLPPQIRRAVDAGSDHIVVKPVTIEGLLDRIRLLVRGRKPFVVTSDYIGPDRRREPRPGPSAPLIEVPNALRVKATRSVDSRTLRGAIRRAASEINRRKLERDAVHIAWLVERIVDGGAEVRWAHLQSLLETAEDLARRLDGTAQDHVSDLCGSLIQVTETLLCDPGRADGGREMRVLPHLAAAIRAAFPDHETAGVARDIVESVARLGSV